MTNPVYMRTAARVRDELYAGAVVVIVIGRSGSVSVGHSGGDQEGRIAEKVMWEAVNIIEADDREVPRARER